MGLAGTRKAETAALCRKFFYFFASITILMQRLLEVIPARSRRRSENYLFYFSFRLDDEIEAAT